MRIVVADDHSLVRAGLMQLLKTLPDDHDMIEAETRAEVMALADKHINLLLLDLDMPGIGSAKKVEQLCNALPSTAVVVISGNEDSHIIDACLDAGVMGFIPKSSSNQVLLNAIQLVLSGDEYVPYTFLKQKRLQGDLPDKVTARQSEIWQLIARGQSNKEIARTLGLTEGTVKQHVAALFKTLNIHSRSEAMLKAQEIWG
ncbi:MAG: hypothetical protein AUK35_05450 [Zetaproteobacteria bacterium CG2_30_46_52]|nr:MAG: hypothetical protein AUK35_05450 [Zetaproteobacteria bacterium CG2_30_46_52]